MHALSLLATVVFLHLIALISPGPDFILCARNSLTYSRKTGLWTSVGIGAGIAVHLIYCIAGLALVISQSILLFNSFKLLGAAYLIYIGLKSFFAKSSEIKLNAEQKKADISVFSAIKMGFLTNVLNPKATLFFLSLFTLVIAPETPKPILIIASIMMVIETIAWFSLVTVFLTQKKIRGVFERFQNVFNKAFGGILIALGVKVAVSQR